VTVQGLFPTVQYPRVPGHEVIGVVDAIGAAVHGWSVGQRAGVGWFGGSCGYCRQCRRDSGFACENVHEISGVTRDGGYATHMIANVSAVAHVPDNLDAVQSAPLLCAGVTTFNALRHTGAGPGDVVAVHGVGGLGHLAIQYAARQGFRTVAVNRGRDKEDLAKKARRKRLYRQRDARAGQGADRDGRRESNPRHRHRQQGDGGDRRRPRRERV
jgi:D-arabinose 1-dehydrogenase-like Zn-dependent alcohol dehydrogenase